MASGGGTGIDDLIVISTETIEQKAGNLIDSCTSLRNAGKPVKAAGESLKAINSASGNCISKQLQDLYDAETAFFKNVTKLERGAHTLRNIGITYDNAEKTIAGEKTRDLIWPDWWPDGEPSGSDDPGKDGGSPEKKSDAPKWVWNKREGLTSMEDAPWYDVPFDYSHKIQIGQKKRINYPSSGEYRDQKTFAWAAGINFLQAGYSDNPLERYNPQTGQTESYGLKEFKPVGSDGGRSFAPSKCGTIAEIYVEYACSWTLAGAQASKYAENYSGFAEAYALRAQAKVHAGVGAFVYKMPDGTMAKAYGLSADVGASFTLAGASASGDAGYNYLGVMGSASVVAGEVYAKANVTVGMVGGQFYAVAKGAVGADLVRATVSGGVRVLGVEVQGSATAKIGLSAKFEVGLEGSKFKANIGAALGIGVEFSINIDFSKAVSVVKDLAETVVSGVSKVGRAVVSLFRRRW